MPTSARPSKNATPRLRRRTSVRSWRLRPNPLRGRPQPARPLHRAQRQQEIQRQSPASIPLMAGLKGDSRMCSTSTFTAFDGRRLGRDPRAWRAADNRYRPRSSGAVSLRRPAQARELRLLQEQPVEERRQCFRSEALRESMLERGGCFVQLSVELVAVVVERAVLLSGRDEFCGGGPRGARIGKPDAFGGE
jgi:hypothetical protein